MASHSWLLLAGLPIVCAWAPSRWREAVVLSTAALLVLAGLGAGALTPAALPALLALFGCAWWAGRSTLPWRPLGWGLFIALALAIALRLSPGFASLALTEPQVLKPGSLPYAVHLNLGKALVAVAILLWLVPLARSRADWRASLSVLPVVGATALSVLLLGWAIGYTQPMPGLPPAGLTLAWATLNLLVACTLEEGFFRGLLQRGLDHLLPSWVAIGATALLFGLAHVAGGWPLMLLASVAGAGYGLAYAYSGQRLEAAILCHFAVNALHFALFTYPSG